MTQSSYVCFGKVTTDPLITSVSPGLGYFRILLLDWIPSRNDCAWCWTVSSTRAEAMIYLYISLHLSLSIYLLFILLFYAISHLYFIIFIWIIIFIYLLFLEATVFKLKFPGFRT